MDSDRLATTRVERLYRVLFETIYWADLTDLGFDDVRRNLAQVHARRNAFAHGDPQAIDDSLVASVGDKPKREQEAWSFTEPPAVDVNLYPFWLSGIQLPPQPGFPAPEAFDKKFNWRPVLSAC
jgi:hypothetical protein